MFEKFITNPDIQVALIEGMTSILTTVIPAIILYFGSRNFFKLKNATSTSISALRELLYIRELYAEACSRLAVYEDKKPKGVDKVIRQEMSVLGIKSEGKLPPKEIERRMTVYSKQAELTFPTQL